MARKTIDRNRVACLDCLRLDTGECPRGAKTLSGPIVCFAYALDPKSVYQKQLEAAESGGGGTMLTENSICPTCRRGINGGKDCSLLGIGNGVKRACSYYQKGCAQGAVVGGCGGTSVVAHTYFPPVKTGPTTAELLAAAERVAPAEPVQEAGIDRNPPPKVVTPPVVTYTNPAATTVDKSSGAVDDPWEDNYGYAGEGGRNGWTSWD